METLDEARLDSAEAIGLAVDIVSAFVSNNSLPSTDLAPLLTAVHKAITDLKAPSSQAAPVARTPAVPVKKSITPEHLVCLEDGKTFKSLKRHLRARYNLTPEEYRARWDLPPDYPMVAPNYAATRSQLAKNMGLGQQRREGREDEAAEESDPPAPRRRARRAAGA